jgi:hypothetical protein
MRTPWVVCPSSVYFRKKEDAQLFHNYMTDEFISYDT